MFGGLLRVVFRDHELQKRLVEANGSNWTIVRPSAFTNGPAIGTFRTAFPSSLRGLKLKIAASDVAGFLTRQLSDCSFYHRAVAISC